jgi:RimJ/RimL family protein N-acetyltransferase
VEPTVPDASPAAPPVTLETERLVLTQLGAEDVAELIAMYQNRRVTRHITATGTRTRDETEAFLGRMLEHWRTHGYGYLVVRVRGEARIAGGCGLMNLTPDAGPELGYVLDEPAWGKGFATELGKRMLIWAFDELGLQRVTALVAPENDGSLRVLRKLGMFWEGRTTGVDGLQLERFAITRGNWEEHRS